MRTANAMYRIGNVMKDTKENMMEDYVNPLLTSP